MMHPAPLTPLPFFHPVSLIATWFGAGKIPFAPGTFGSLAALPFAYAIHVLAGREVLLLAALILFLIGVAASEAYMRRTGGVHDTSEIVIDEVAGQCLILVALTPTLPAYALGFVLFRLFDIFKPWPISICDTKILGGFGIMIDDFVAAIYPVFLFALFSVGCAVTGNGHVLDMLFSFFL